LSGVKIVILDGYATNPGDLSWDGLERLGTLTVYDRTVPAEVEERARDAAVVLTNKVALDAPTIAALPELRYIGVMATGYNVVDVAAAKEQGIVVTNVPAYGTRSVAQMVFALLLELTQHVGYHAQTVREGRWSCGPDWSYRDFPLIELDGLTLGVIGYGRIGREVAGLGRAFGMQVVSATRTPAAQRSEGVTFLSVDEIFTRADVVSLHCPLTAETDGLVSRERLARMKPTALLINTARGPLVDEAALAEALQRGTIAGAGLDVLSVEPPRPDNPLLTAPNCIITPHMAWATTAARRRLTRVLEENLAAFLAGQPQNVVA
jgi:glycerate dehydrogenase